MLRFGGSAQRRATAGHALIVALLALCAYADAKPASAALEAVWSWQPDAGIEWIELVGGDESPAVLVATRDARLHVLNAESGESRLTTPVEAHPGVRPADNIRAQPCAYCYDRFAVYALDLRPAPALTWRAGAWSEGLDLSPTGNADASRVFQGDPEELRRIVAAVAAPSGVLVARDDGWLGLMQYADGHMRWERHFPPLATQRLHVCGERAALVYRGNSRVAATLLDVQTGRRRDIPLPADMTWPIWSDLTASGLVLVQPTRVGLWNADGLVSAHETDAGGHILAASVAVHSGVLIFGTTDGTLRALDLATATPRWAVNDATGWTFVDIRGDVVVTDKTLRKVQDGQPLASFDADTRIVSASQCSTKIWVLCISRSGLTARRIADGGVAQTVPLGPAQGFRRALWTQNRVVVAMQSALRAYPLP